MKKDSDISLIDLLIGKYLSGSASKEETKEFLAWLESSSQNREYYAQSQILWLQSEKEPIETEKNRWEQLQLRLKERESYKKRIHLNFRNRFNLYLGIAASMLILISITTIYLLNKPDEAPSVAKNVFEVPYGSKSLLTLPDGTKLWVNAGSTLAYNTDFGKNNRDITLIGEAYFDVAKNLDLPFVVHAANIKIKAVGTEFNVKAYPDEKRVETTLVEGIVEIEKTGLRKHLYLKPNQKITFSNVETDTSIQSSTQVVVTSKGQNAVLEEESGSNIKITNKIDTHKETSWKDGKLIFDREPLINLTVRLERRYDVHFTFASEKLKDYKYTGSFNDVSLEQIMEAMKLSSPINYIIKEKQVEIMGKK